MMQTLVYIFLQWICSPFVRLDHWAAEKQDTAEARKREALFPVGTRVRLTCGPACRSGEDHDGVWVVDQFHPEPGDFHLVREDAPEEGRLPHTYARPDVMERVVGP